MSIQETGMADDAFPAECSVCGSSSNLKRCSRCKCAFYCSREHQAKHWPKHKTICKQLQSTPHNKSVNVQDKTTTEEKEKDLKSSENNNVSETDKNKSSSQVDLKGTSETDEGRTKSLPQSNDSFIEFDTRPFKNTVFASPPSYEFEELANYMTNNLTSAGYCVVDGLFKADLLGKVKDEFDSVNEKGLMNPGQLSGGKTSGEDKLKVTKSEIRSDKLVWIEGTESHIPATGEVVTTMDDIIGRFNQYLAEECFIKGRTKAMMACYPGNGSFYRRHVDNPNKDGRVITCILYLNNDWDVEKDGGMLRILPENSEDHVDIAPVFNRLLVFWSDRRNPHEVHPAHKTRYALTVWYFDAEERVKAKEDHISEEMSRIRGELSLLDVQTKKAEKDNVAQKIANESMKAVAALSEDELDALAALVKGHSDPSDVLSGLGIAVSIQDALLAVLSNRNTSI